MDRHDLAEEFVFVRLSGLIGIEYSSKVAIVLELACQFYVLSLSLRSACAMSCYLSCQEMVGEIPERFQG